MKQGLITSVLLLLLSAVAFAQPTITSLTPSSGTVGSSVVIAGTGFSTTASNNIVYFGGVMATVTVASATSLTVTVPAGATYQPTSVTVSGLTGYSAKPFVVTYTPLSAGISASTFAAHVDITTGSSPRGIALGDIDGDGKLDVVNANNTTNTLSVFRNAIQGAVTAASFTGPTLFTAVANPLGVALGDLDGDGKLDMTSTGNGGTIVSVFRNINSAPGTISASTFSAVQNFATGGGSWWVTLSDLDLDGKPDMIVANSTSNTLSVFRNTSTSGSISFALKVDFATLGTPYGVTAVDFDQDGKNDLAVTGGGSVSVFRNVSTTGTFTTSSLATRVDFATGTTPNGVAFSDVDGDNKPDLAVTNNASNTISVFRNISTSGTFTTSSFATKVDFNTNGGLNWIGFSDFDGDGKPDMVTSNTNGATVFRNTATSGVITTSSFSAGLDLPASTTPVGLALGDMDGDGKTDILVSNSGIATLSVIMNSNLSLPPTITSLSPPSGPVGSSVVIAGTGFSTTKANNIVYFGGVMATVTQASATSLTVTVPPGGATNQPPSVTVSGLTGYASKPFTSTYTPVTTGISSNTFLTKVDVTTGLVPQGVALGDIDGDGKLDVVSASANTGTVSVFRNAIQGSVTAASLTGPISFAVGTSPLGVVLGDLDGDGRLDMAATNSTSTSVSVFRNISTTPGTISASTFSTKQDFVTGTSPQQIALSDLDLDGKPEMIVANSVNSTISVFRNTSSVGSISFATKVDFTTLSGPISVSAVDLDQDGKNDLAVTCGGSLSVFRNLSTPGTISASSLGTRVDFATGTSPYSVAFSDIDGDGKPDLGVANFGSNTLSVFRNQSTSGSFTSSSLAAKVDITTNGSPYAVAFSDLDGDGKPEMVVANIVGASVYRNVSTSGSITTSSFSAKVDYTASTTPYALALGDLDGDGKSDILVSNANAGTISVIMNNNVSAPPTITSFTPASGPVGTSVVIVGTGFSTTASNNIVYFGGVAANVTAATATSLTVTVPPGATYQPASVTVAGLTGYSSKPFTVTYSALTTGISATNFLPKVDVTTGSSLWGISLGDIDGDGKLDLVNANGIGSYLSVFRNAIQGGVTAASFTGPTNFTTGTNPVGTALGDLDGDGKLDMVATNYASATVSVFRNINSSPGTISTSTFSTKQDFVTGTSPQQVVLSDLDLDGKPEIIVTNYGSGTVSVLRNTSNVGSISFATKVDLTTLSSPFGVIAVDVDQDGKNDLAVTATGSVSVFRNQSLPGTISTSSFGTKLDFTTGSNAAGLSFTDIDGDGKPDLAVVNNTSNTISLFRNQSTQGSITSGSLAAKFDFTTNPGSTIIAFADLDGDGKSEMVTANSLGASVYRNVATSGAITSSTFSTKVDFTASIQPSGLTLGDVDGDGKTDILVTNATSGTISVIMNNNLSAPPTITSLTPSSGVVGATVTIAGTNFNTVASKNIVRFGSIKAAVTSATATQIVVTVPAGATFEPVSVTTNGLIAYSAKPFSVTFPSLGGISTSSFSTKIDIATNINPYDLAIADIDDDGKSDLSVTNYGSGLVSIYRNQSTLGTINASSFAAKVDFATPSSPYEIVSSDFDGDGVLDLATASFSGSVASLFRNTTTAPGSITTSTLATRVDLTSSTGPNGIGAADFDGDGLTDLIVNDNSNTSITIWRNIGKVGAIAVTSFATSTDLVVGSLPYSVAIGDLDGDGKPDIAIPNAGAGTISLFRNTSTPGSISFTAKSDITCGSNPLGISIGDLDGDGKLDMAVAISAAATVSVYRNVATSGSLTSASFGTKTDFTPGSNPTSVSLSDLDGDGKLDMVASNSASATISIFNNKSTGTGSISFNTKVDLTTGTTPSRVNMGDLDGDGRPEIVVQNYGSNTLSIFRNLVPNISVTTSTFPATFTKGSTILVNVTLSSPVTSTVKFYSKGISDSDTNYASQTVTPTGSKYEVTLGNTNFTDAIGLVYYFDFGNGVTLGSSTYLAYAATATDQVIPSLSFGSSLGNYQIISIPLKITNTASTSVFKALGSYDKKKWRLYSYSGTSYTENPSTIDFGKGYWLIVKASTVINPGDATTPQVSTTSPATISLSAGWNLIGNPYNFRVSWADVLAANGNPTTVGKLRIFSGTSLADGTFLEKYRGAFVNATAAITLKIPVLKNTTLGGRQAEVTRTLNPIDQPDWELGISVTDGELSNQMGAIGMHPTASVNQDSFDEESIPMPTGFGLFEIVFRQPKSSKTFEKDFVPSSGSYTWEFNVNRGDHEGPVALKWSNDYFGDNGKQLFLFDETMAAAVDMRAVTEYGLGPESNKMKVIYGDKDYIDNFLDVSLPLIGRAFPNPASETTGITVPFRIPENGGLPMPVNVAVYDTQGRMLATLINGEYAKGNYEAKWQPSVSAGLYCIQTRVGLENQVQKVFIK